ncbi:MAG: hypothetical protein EOO06_04325 [Chitinophagaceae bacterium]|nr:MAG: hypothetical protein EOO06_04325 [Chitinophagaceae bacterium]
MYKTILAKALICTLLLVGCKSKEEKPSEAEAQQFAASISKDASDRQINFLEKNIVLPALMDRMYELDEIKKLKASRSGMEKGVEQGLKKHNYEKTLFETLGNNGTFQLVKLYEKDGKRRSIFRAFGSGGLNYFDMELTKVDNKVGIADMLVYTTGENISRSMAEISEKIFSAGTTSQDQIGPALINIKRHLASEDFESAKAEYDRLPQSLKNTKLLESVYLSILPNLSGTENQAEMERIEKKYAADPNSQLMLIDIYIARKDYDKTLAAVDVMDKNINKDPFLDYYRGLIHNLNGKSEEAIAHFEKVAAAMPDFADNYAELFAHHAKENNKEKAKQYFAAYKKLKQRDPEVVSYYETEYPYLAE